MKGRGSMRLTRLKRHVFEIEGEMKKLSEVLGEEHSTQVSATISSLQWARRHMFNLVRQLGEEKAADRNSPRLHLLRGGAP